MTRIVCCGGAIGQNVFETCHDCPNRTNAVPMLPPYSVPNMGWQCPKCGRGNAPFVLQCPCGPSYTTTLGAGSGSPGDSQR